jgi:hypothetical protein
LVDLREKEGGSVINMADDPEEHFEQPCADYCLSLKPTKTGLGNEMKDATGARH